MKTAATVQPLSRASAAMLPLSLVLAWVAAAITQRFNAPSLGPQLVASLLAAPLMAWAFRRHWLDRPRVVLLAIVSVPVALMLASSLRTSTPMAAILGVGPNWQGWLLWASALGWFWVAVAAADGRDLARIVRALVWLGSITSVWALLEAAGVLGTYQARSGPAAMAFFDSPNSMGQALVITVAATLSIAVRRGIRPQARMGYFALALLQVLALFAGGARAALVGLVVAVAAYGFLAPSHDRKTRAIRAASATALAGGVVSFMAVGAAWSGVFGPAAYARVDELLTGRFAIWNHVRDIVLGNPIVGVGTVPFDAVISWDVMADGSVAASITYDQHSILLTWLMGTGFIGFTVFGLAAVALGTLIMRSASTPNSTSSVRMLAAGGAALFVSMLSTWPEPLALLSVSLVMGGLVSNGALAGPRIERRFSRRSPIVAMPAVGASIAAILCAIALAPALGARMTTARADAYQDLVDRIERALESTNDYSYLAYELAVIDSAGSLAVSDTEAVDKLRKLAQSYPAEAAHLEEVPLMALNILSERTHVISPAEFWELSRFYVEQGRRVDPSHGIWDYALARAAYLAQRDDAPRFTQAALAKRMPDSAKLALQLMR